MPIGRRGNPGEAEHGLVPSNDIAALGLLLANGSAASSLIVGRPQPPQPTVQPPVTPKETGKDLRKLPPSEPPKPGEPVREVPDLKRTEIPSKRGPAVPEVLAGDLRRLPALEPWPPGKSVRIVRPQGSAAARYEIHLAEGAFAVREGAGALHGRPIRLRVPLARYPRFGSCRAGSDQPLTARYDPRPADGC